MSKPVLQIQNLTKTYMLGKRPVHSSVKPKPHKSTRANSQQSWVHPAPEKPRLLNIIGCIDKATSGSIQLDGIDVSSMPENQLYKIRRDKMGFVFQTFNLLPYLNAVENVELPMEGQNEHQKLIAEKEQANSLQWWVCLDEKTTDPTNSALENSNGSQSHGHLPTIPPSS